MLGVHTLILKIVDNLSSLCPVLEPLCSGPTFAPCHLPSRSQYVTTTGPNDVIPRLPQALGGRFSVEDGLVLVRLGWVLHVHAKLGD